MLDVLARAQRGDQAAISEIVVHILNESSKARIGGYGTPDPAFDPEDLRQVFAEAVIKAIPAAKLDVGNPFQFLAQCGQWAVQTLMRSIDRKAAGRLFRGYDVLPENDEGQTGDLLDVYTDRTEGDFREVVIERDDSARVIRIIAGGPLAPRTRDLMDAIVSGVGGQPGEIGYHKRLADHMGISPQRVSQLLKRLQRDAEVVLPKGF